MIYDSIQLQSDRSVLPLYCSIVVSQVILLARVVSWDFYRWHRYVRRIVDGHAYSCKLV